MTKSLGGELRYVDLSDGSRIVCQMVYELGTYVHCHAETGAIGLLRSERRPARLRRGERVWILTTHVLEKIGKRRRHTIWTSADGSRFLVRRMSQDHLENTWHMQEREIVRAESDYRHRDGRLAAPRATQIRDVRRAALWVQAFAREMERRVKGR